MADTLYAYTRVVAGITDDDGNNQIVKYDAGDVIDVALLGKDVVRNLIKSGAVATYNRLDVEAAGGGTGANVALATENASLRAEVEALKAQLADTSEQEAEEPSKPTPTPQPGEG